jgi:NDP-sugar pyrophosphorylase family protein
MNDTRVVILAGGKGVRLRPFTASLPKPLVPLGDKPILEILLHQLAACGIKRATLTLGHLSGLIRAFVTQQVSLGESMDIDFVDEETPTGTAGSLVQVPDLNDTFLVMNGDVLTDLNYGALVNAHKASGASLTIASHRQDVEIDLGVLETDDEGKITAYHEKPKHSYEVSMGVYVYEPSVMELIKPGEYLDFPDLVLRLLARGDLVKIYRNNAFWLDIGRPEDYAKAQDLVESEPERFGLEMA